MKRCAEGNCIYPRSDSEVSYASRYYYCVMEEVKARGGEKKIKVSILLL